MKLEEFKTALEGLENGKDLYSFYVNAVNKEREYGIEEKRKVNKEAEGLRKYKIALEKFGFDKDADELDAFLEEMKKTKNKAKEVDSTKLTLEQVNSELAALQEKFTAAQKELANERSVREKLALDSKRKTIKAKLVETLRDRVYGDDFVAETLINEGKVDLEGDSVFFKEGENKIAFEEGIKNLLEKRTDIVKNTQRGGANSQPAGGNNKKFTVDQIEKMSKEDVAANLNDIKASLGITTAT